MNHERHKYNLLAKSRACVGAATRSELPSSCPDFPGIIDSYVYYVPGIGECDRVLVTL
jgi:hypothetical protein